MVDVGKINKQTKAKINGGGGGGGVDNYNHVKLKTYAN
jgi:hypothetical protein